MGWTITELAAAATAALSGEPAQVNGRIRDLPNERMIRWYTTIGLVDPPLARRGRTARYGRRHLLQLVAVKRRQATGQTIAQIQVELTGATDRTLEQIARLPHTAPAVSPAAAPTEHGAGDQTGHEAEHEAEKPAENPRSRGRFWTASAHDHAEVRGAVERTVPRPPAVGDEPAGDEPAGELALVHGVRLAPGALLLLDLLDGDPPGGDDLAALRVAARPLLEELSRRGLLPAATPPPSAQFPTGRST